MRRLKLVWLPRDMWRPLPRCTNDALISAPTAEPVSSSSASTRRETSATIAHISHGEYLPMLCLPFDFFKDAEVCDAWTHGVIPGMSTIGAVSCS